MIAKPFRPPVPRKVFLLGGGKLRLASFSRLSPAAVGSVAKVRQSIGEATKDSLWVSYDERLTEALAGSEYGPPRTLGRAVFVHTLAAKSIPALASRFHRYAFASVENFLPPDELAEALAAENAADLFIGGNPDPSTRLLTLWRGNLEPLVVPLSTFETSGDGVAPDFEKFTATDFGQTIRLGEYEAAADAILYEFDPDYRHRISKRRRESERSFGASVRRLRRQRGLRREDFQPEIAAKSIARIERGEVSREKIRSKTLAAIARRLQVRPDEIEGY